MAGIYIHIPFCKQACHYCNFHFSTTLQLKTKLIDCIVKEIKLRKDFFDSLSEENRIIDTLYFGGGTPSLLTRLELDSILNALFKHFNISPNVEITLEANPDDLDISVLKDLKSLKVNRLSIGIQSFIDAHLTYMNRAHNANEALQCIEDCLQYGFENLNIDLIYGLPELTTKIWEQQLDRINSFPIHHISAYALTVEPNTALDHFIKKGKVKKIKDELAAEQFLITSQYLESIGFKHYEVSNFAKDEAFSKHNTSYWKGKPYLGIGPSAHSFINQTRNWNISNNAKYTQAISAGNSFNEQEILSVKDQLNEYLLTGLRTIWGVDLSYIERNFGLKSHQYILNQLRLINTNQYKIEDNRLQLNKQGWLWSDFILEKLISI